MAVTEERTRQIVAQTKTQLIARIEESNPGLAGELAGDGWLDEMLLNFFSELAKRVGELFLTLTEPLKNQLQSLGEEIYKSGIERLQPEPPITFDKIVSIAGDATADAIAEQVLIMSGAIIVQMIPFVNVSAINQLLQLYADLSPDTEIARVVTRRMVDALVREPLDQFMMSKYRPRRMSRSDAEAAYKAGKLTKEGFAEILAQDGIPDKDIAVILAVTDMEILTKVKGPPPGPTDFETLLGDVALLDTWDGLLAKWLSDLKARASDLSGLIKEARAEKTPETEKAAAGLEAKLKQVKAEEREVWQQREKLLTVLSSLRRLLAGAVTSQALDVISRHKAQTKIHADELKKDPSKVVPGPRKESVRFRGTGTPKLRDLERALELRLARERVPPTAVDPRVRFHPEDLKYLGETIGTTSVEGTKLTVQEMYNLWRAREGLPPTPAPAPAPAPTPPPAPVETPEQKAAREKAEAEAKAKAEEAKRKAEAEEAKKKKAPAPKISTGKSVGYH